MVKLFKYLFVAALLIILSGSEALTGQDHSADSLYYYLTLAARQNPAVLQKFSEYNAALQKVPQVGALPDPELTVGVFVKPMELVMGNQVADLKLMQMFPWFGTLKSAKDEMSLMAKAKYESFREARLQVYYDVQAAWNELYMLKKNLEISDKNLQILNIIEQLAIVRFRTPATGGGTSSNTQPAGRSNIQGVQNTNQQSSGMTGMQGGQAGANRPGQISSGGSMQGNAMGGSGEGLGLVDLYRIQIEIGNLKNDTALLRDRERSMMAKFNSYLDRPSMFPVTVADTLKADTLNLPLAAVNDSMLTNNPMLKMLTYEKQSAEAKKKMVTRMGYPMVGLGVDYSVISKLNVANFPMNGKDMIMPMVSATIPIYRKKYRAMQNEADLIAQSTGQNYTATANNLQADYYQAVEQFRDANRRISLYSGQYLLAKKSLDIKLASFSAGSSNLTDVLIIRQQTLDYELSKAKAVIDCNTSIARLKQLMATF